MSHGRQSIQGIGVDVRERMRHPGFSACINQAHASEAGQGMGRRHLYGGFLLVQGCRQPSRQDGCKAVSVLLQEAECWEAVWENLVICLWPRQLCG